MTRQAPFALGGYFAGRLAALQGRHSIPGWIDARGLFVGLEFVRDRAVAAGPSGRHCHPAAYSTGISP